MWYPYIMLIKMRYILTFFWGGGFFPPFVHVDKGGGVCKMSTLVHSRGEGVKVGQNLVHVVVECPLSTHQFSKNSAKNVKIDKFSPWFQLVTLYFFPNLAINKVWLIYMQSYECMIYYINLSTLHLDYFQEIFFFKIQLWNLKNESYWKLL